VKSDVEPGVCGTTYLPSRMMTANPDTYQRMRDNTVCDCSETIFGPRTMDELDFVETVLLHLRDFM